MKQTSILRTKKNLGIGDVLKPITGKFKIIKSFNGEVISETPWIKNKVMKSDTHGVNLIVREIIGDHTYSVEVTHAKIGTGTTPPTDTDTDLETPTVIGGGPSEQILRGSGSVISINIAELMFFISTADLPNGTYSEWGLFNADDKMMSRALITPNYSKSTNQDTTVVHQLTFNN